MSKTARHKQSVTVDEQNDEVRLYPQGPWALPFFQIAPEVPLFTRNFNRVILDGSRLDHLDTTGAMLLHDIVLRAGGASCDLLIENLSQQQGHIIGLVRERLGNLSPAPAPERLSFVSYLGKAAYYFIVQLTATIAFFGETAAAFSKLLWSPAKLRPRELFVYLESAGVRAVPICALVTFLIGVVVAYLFAAQAERFGATIFIVEAVSMSMTRELSPVIVSIIVAGRSGSAFTAHLGAMKLNDEVDALSTLGLSPQEVLVLPRVLALVLTLPLLVFIGDAAGILGGMLIAKYHLNLEPVIFLERMREMLPIRFLWLGMLKAPVFAAFIAIIACRMGLAAEKNARSVGLHTTSTVVQSIVAVILLDAGFAILFQELEL